MMNCENPIFSFMKGMAIGLVVAAGATMLVFSNKKAVKKMKNIANDTHDNISTMFNMK